MGRSGGRSEGRSSLRDFFEVVRPSAATWITVGICSAIGIVNLFLVRQIPALRRIEARGSS